MTGVQSSPVACHRFFVFANWSVTDFPHFR
jgi:hypothetical protein